MNYIDISSWFTLHKHIKQNENNTNINTNFLPHNHKKLILLLHFFILTVRFSKNKSYQLKSQNCYSIVTCYRSQSVHYIKIPSTGPKIGTNELEICTYCDQIDLAVQLNYNRRYIFLLQHSRRSYKSGKTAFGSNLELFLNGCNLSGFFSRLHGFETKLQQILHLTKVSYLPILYVLLSFDLNICIQLFGLLLHQNSL